MQISGNTHIISTLRKCRRSRSHPCTHRQWHMRTRKQHNGWSLSSSMSTLARRTNKKLNHTLAILLHCSRSHRYIYVHVHLQEFLTTAWLAASCPGNCSACTNKSAMSPEMAAAQMGKQQHISQTETLKLPTGAETYWVVSLLASPMTT